MADWADAIETLAKIAVQYLQTAYVGFVFCLQAEWQYVSCAVPDTAAFFQPLEVCIRKYFCPALIGIEAHEIDGKFRELLSHRVKKGGLEIRNPLDQALDKTRMDIEGRAYNLMFQTSPLT